MSAASSTAAVGRIPVKNLWLLMLYASKYREIPKDQRARAEDNPDDIPDLVAEILNHEVERRLRRNLSLELEHRRADLTRVRGRIDHLRTERRHLLQQGRIACVFDEFTADTPKNRFVKAALDELTNLVKEEELKQRCRTNAAALERAGVSMTSLHMRHDRTAIAAGRINSEDRRMLDAAELALDLRLPTEERGGLHLPAPDRSNEHWVRNLFERAVGGFYKVVLGLQWKIDTGKKIRWKEENPSGGIVEILPVMVEDIRLESPDKSRIIIDTKFTEILTKHYEKNRLRSDHIYQIYAYLRSQESEDDPSSLNSSGVLLYPSVDKDVDESAVIQGHRIRFATVDLAADSSKIRERLQSLVLDSSSD